MADTPRPTLTLEGETSVTTLSLRTFHVSGPPVRMPVTRIVNIPVSGVPSGGGGSPDTFWSVAAQ